MLNDFLLPVMNRSKSPSNHPGYRCKARSLLFTSARSHWVYWWFFFFHCAKTIESLLFTSVRSNLYSSGIRARQPIIHTCLQQKSTCNLGFLLSHLQVYTPSAQLHRIQKAINRPWIPFSCFVQGVLKSHKKGKTIILYPSFCVHARLCPINMLSRFIPSQRLLVVVLLQQCNSHLTPFLLIFWPVIAGKVRYRCTHTTNKTQTYLFTFAEYCLYQNTTFLLSHNLIYTTELRG